MGKKTVKATAAIALLGTVLQFGGCIGQVFQQALAGIPVYLVSEFLLDNDGVFDLFAD
jgi:hypothetical protein